MNRRMFLTRSMYLPVLFAPAVVVRPEAVRADDRSAVVSVDARTPEERAIMEQIAVFEAQLRQSAGVFSWELHNELRHLYIQIDEAKAMAHADAILAHSVMDSYILNTLSDWHLEGQFQPYDLDLGVARLAGRAERYPALSHLAAACLIKAGDECRRHDRDAEAAQFYRNAKAYHRVYGTERIALAVYHNMATVRLSAL